jgi:hypothetical protein
MPPEDPGRQAERAFLSGFSGCLGVGLAVALASGLLLAGCSLLVHIHG